MKKSASPDEIANLSIRQTQLVTHAATPRLVDSHAFRDQHRWTFLPKKKELWYVGVIWAQFRQHIWGRKAKTKRETSLYNISKTTGLLTCPFYPLIDSFIGSDGGTMKFTKNHQLGFNELETKPDATTMMNHTFEILWLYFLYLFYYKFHQIL